MIRPFILCLILVAVAVVTLSTGSVSAQSFQMFLPNIQMVFTSPIAEPPPVGWPSDRPAPYDVQAQEVAIQLEDTPMGFYLDSSATIEPSATLLDIGFANGYETLLYNNDDIFVSHFAVGSLAYVFMSPEGAELLHEAALAVYLDDPEYRQLSVPSIGDETSAFVSQSTIEGFLVEYFVVVARQGNVNAIVLVGGLAEVTRLSDAVGYARRMLEKAAHNGVLVASEGTGNTQVEIANHGALRLPALQEWTEGVDKQIGTHLKAPY